MSILYDVYVEPKGKTMYTISIKYYLFSVIPIKCENFTFDDVVEAYAFDFDNYKNGVYRNYEKVYTDTFINIFKITKLDAIDKYLRLLGEN